MENTNSNETKSRGRPRIYNFPSELTCTVTGKVVKTNPLQFQHGLDESGKTQEEFIATYVSREGRKLQRIAAEKAGAAEKAAAKAKAREQKKAETAAKRETAKAEKAIAKAQAKAAAALAKAEAAAKKAVAASAPVVEAPAASVEA